MKNGKTIAQWAVGGFFALTTLVNGIHWTSILFLLAAVLMMPIPPLRELWKKWNLKKGLIITLASILFFVGCAFSPLGESADLPDNDDSSYSEDEGEEENKPSNPDSTPSNPDSTPSNPENNENPSVSGPDTPEDGNGGGEENNTTPDNPSQDPPAQDPPAQDPPAQDPPVDDTPTVTPSVGNGVATPVDPTTLPAYSGTAFVVVDNNIPSFSSSELTTVGYEKYSPLDPLGRCGAALASCGREIMPGPDEERGSISSVYPSGWIQASYSGISGGYLWNRCHLLGWQLSAENANRQNLITGTRYMNINGMLPFENMIADYIKETGNHVAFRVTPIFEGNNLVCSGVQMEAYSIEDNGEGICFNVYCYNVQPGIVIDYATGASSLPGGGGNTDTPPSDTPSGDNNTPGDAGNNDDSDTMVWIPNSGTKYHSNPNCSNMKNPHEVTLEEAEEDGYTPCKKCYG